MRRNLYAIRMPRQDIVEEGVRIRELQQFRIRPNGLFRSWGKARRLTYDRKASRLTFPGSNLALSSPAPSASGQHNRPRIPFVTDEGSRPSQTPGRPWIAESGVQEFAQWTGGIRISMVRSSPSRSIPQRILRHLWSIQLRYLSHHAFFVPVTPATPDS